MNQIRSTILRYRGLAFLLVLATLWMKAILPTGYMVGQNSKVLTVQICSDGLDNHSVQQLVIPMKDGGSDSGSKQGKAECPFASLSMATLGGADPALLAVALVFILAMGFVAAPTSHPKPLFYLRPPLRGPPALV